MNTRAPQGEGTTATAEAPTNANQIWIDYIGPFATTIGKSPEETTELLKPLVGEPGEQAIALLQDATLSPDTDIKALLSGVPGAVQNQAIRQLRASTAMPQATMAYGIEVLPDVPSEDAWISALRAGGQLKVDQATVIAAVRAALASRLRLYDVPDLLTAKMEEYSSRNAEPVGAEFFKLRKQITQRTYGDIFEAIPGLEGNFVTDSRRRDLLNRVDTHLWPALIGFHGQLKGWMDAWQQGAANPAAMMSLMLSMNGAGSALPGGLMQPPDSGVLRDSADSFNDEVNKVFSGVGVPIARALAYDAKRIKETLENPDLPRMVGAGSREEMLRMLGVDVTATYTRLETNLTKYTLSVMQVKDQPGGNAELQFLTALYMLGAQIPWTELQKGPRSN